MNADAIPKKAITYATSLCCIILCWGVIVLNAPILKFTPILGGSSVSSPVSCRHTWS